MNRRGFLKLFAGAAAGVALAPVVKSLPAGTKLTDLFPRGLAFLVNGDTGAFQGISRAAYPELKSPVVNMAGGSITLADIQKARELLNVRDYSW